MVPTMAPCKGITLPSVLNFDVGINYIISYFYPDYHSKHQEEQQRQKALCARQSKQRSQTKRHQALHMPFTWGYTFNAPLCTVFSSHITLPHFNRTGREKTEARETPTTRLNFT